MANGINGAGKLVERILADARAEAENTLKQAEDACWQISADAEKEGLQNAAAFEKRRDEAVRAIRERSRTNAELSARKEALTKKRSVLDRAFEQTYEKLCALGEDESARVCRKMLLNEAEGGETVKPAAKDRALIAGMLADINAALNEKSASPLRMSDEDAEGVERGFILYGNGYAKDCSFYALLRDARTQEDTRVSGILFD